MRSPEFHRDVADAIVRVWRLRQRAFGHDVDPDESPVGEHVAMRVPRAGEPGLITWAPRADGTPPRLSTVAEMTASIARCYDVLVPRADIAEYNAAPTAPIALWVVAVGDLGGVARHVLDATRSGIPDWRIFVLCPEGPLADRLRAQGSAVLTAPISPADSLAGGISAVRHAVRTLRPAVVHSHLAYSDFLVAGATTGLPAKMISTEHGIAGNDLVYHGTRWKSRVMELAHSARLRRFDALIAVSQATLDAVRRKWHPQRGLRTVVIPNGVDAPATLPDPVAGRFHVTSLSRLSPEKGLFDLLEAFKLVYDEHPEARLTMAGAGPLGSQLEQRVAELRLDQVVTMPGYVEAEKLLADGDVLVQLSTWENCSYTLLDTLTYGIGVVATNVGGNPQALAGSVLGKDADSEGAMQTIIPASPTKLSRRSLALDGKPVNEPFAAGTTARPHRNRSHTRRGVLKILLRMRSRKARLLITAPYWGGAGGAERAVWSIARAFDWASVHVLVTTKPFVGQWSSASPNVRISHIGSLKWKGSTAFPRSSARRIAAHIVNTSRKMIFARYDIHYAFAYGPNVVGATSARFRAINPCGVHVSTDGVFDTIALEAPDNLQFTEFDDPTVVLPPPFYPLSDFARRPQLHVPAAGFLLTVFNPYGPVKGTEDVERAADSAPWPIIWCHSTRTLDFNIPDRLLNHSNIIHAPDLEPSEIAYLYQKCLAYLCFSTREGFGWAVADALHFNCPIVSRKIGVLSFEQLDSTSFFELADRWDFDWRRLGGSPRPHRPDLSWLSPDEFVKSLVTLATAKGVKIDPPAQPWEMRR